MKPLESLPSDTLRTVLGVASDVDDTLTESGAIVPSSLLALGALARAGVPCVLVTGRPIGWAEVLLRLLPVRAAVAENGGAWVVREEGRARVAFLEDESTRLAGMARVRDAVRALTHEFPQLRPVTDWTVRATDAALDIGEATHVPPEVVAEAEARVRSMGLFAVHSSVHLHVSARPPDKFLGLCAALTDMGFDASLAASRWLYVGDSLNDAVPFGAMDLSIGVANVRAFETLLPVLPQYVTERSHGDGFAEIARALLAARGASA